MKWVFAILSGFLTICFIIGGVRHFMKPQFPWEVLELESAAVSSSLSYNPYADYPPRHRWELGISFRKFALPPGGRPYAPIITYSLDLDHRGWRELLGVYRLESSRGSDFWHGDDNLGPVYLEQIEIKPGRTARYEIVLDLYFPFEDGAYRPQRKRFTFPADYEGLGFTAPIWNEPENVSFPESWAVPSAKPHWRDDEIRKFIAKYVDLEQYDDLHIEQTGQCSTVEAKPK